jgi:hypothetical protein
MRQRLPGAGEAARRIEDYGLLGDTRTAALVAPDGAIDWLCVPRFDGQPVFGRLLGGPPAGRFRMGPDGAATVIARRYRPGTATLQTTWRTPGGRLTLTEGMIADVTGRLLPSSLLVRRLTADGGPVDAVIELDPRLGERHRPPRSEDRGDVVVCSWSTTAIAVRSSPPIRLEAGRPVPLTVAPGHPVTLALSVVDREPLIYVDPDAAWAALEADEHGWQAWCADIDGDLPHRDAVVRSLLTLRLLTYSPSGAPVAAPTTKPATSSPGCSTPAAWTGPASPSCSPSTAATQPRNGNLMAGPATPTAARSASATAPPTSTSSTATAGSSTPPGSSPAPAIGSTPRPGGPCAASPTRSRNGGANPTPESGRSAATAPTTCTPS